MSGDATDPRVGTVLQGRYRILATVAAGAMGAVYRGERVRLGRQVAIKFLHGTFAADPKFTKRFEREAMAMSQLSHPHCVSVIDYGVADAPYIVMDYVAGRTLLDLLDDGRLPSERAIHITRQMLGGLAHAHGQGIIHRDIKPANVILTEATGTGDHVRILDFGLATLLGGQSGDVSQSVIVGTPSYMSPEQSLGEQVDARADVYSSGVLLFQMLTGDKPFAAEDARDMLRMHREQPPPALSDLVPAAGFSPELEAVVARSLAKNPDDRFASAIDFARALDAVPEGFRPRGETAFANTRQLTLDVERPQVEPPRGGRALGAFVVLLLLGSATAGAVVFWSGWRAAAPLTTEGDADPQVELGAIGPESAQSQPHDVVWAVETEVVADAGPSDAGEPQAAPYDAAPSPDSGPADAGVADAAPPDASNAPDEELDFELLEDDPEEAELPDDEREEPVAAMEDDAPRPEAPDAEPAVTVVTTIADATRLIEQGRREAAIQGLRKLRRTYPHNAYVPYLLGSLYFEKTWWSVGIDHYRDAIRLNSAYRTRSILIQNTIRALGSWSSRTKAGSLLRTHVRYAAVPALRRAAKSDPYVEVRARARWLADRIVADAKHNANRRKWRR